MIAKQHILVVEDESSIADTIVYALEEEGFKVCWVARGMEALVHLKQKHFDLMILDVGLPDCNGFELCKEIRTTSSIPIIFLTARDHEVDKIVGLEIGGDDYITKPFSPRELSARVKAILRRSPITTEQAVAKDTITTLTIDDIRKKIFYHGQELPLTRYEYGLLQVLAESPGRVYTRDQLMEKVWDDAGASLDRSVDAHIKSLRAKMRTIHEANDPIITHRAIGYSLQEGL